MRKFCNLRLEFADWCTDINQHNFTIINENTTTLIKILQLSDSGGNVFRLDLAL